MFSGAWTSCIPTHFEIAPKNAPGVFLDVGRDRFEKYCIIKRYICLNTYNSNLDLRSAKVVKVGKESKQKGKLRNFQSHADESYFCTIFHD